VLLVTEGPAECSTDGALLMLIEGGDEAAELGACEGETAFAHVKLPSQSPEQHSLLPVQKAPGAAQPGV